MEAEPLMSAVWRERRGRWGPEDGLYKHGGGSSPLDRVDVFFYRVDVKHIASTFHTVGMAAREMPGGGGRAELDFSLAGPSPSPHLESSIAGLMANLACYPWNPGGEDLQPGHIVTLPTGFPGFPLCSAVLFAGPFLPGDRDSIEADGERVRILNVIPITETEQVLGRSYPYEVFLVHLVKNRDILAPPRS